MKHLKDLFLDELADIHDAENRILKALPKMIKAATADDLKEALQSHLQETEGHVTKVKKVFAAFGETARAKKCDATVGLLEEGDEIAKDNKGEPTINAAVISACQKVEHYEVASYGSLKAWAVKLGNRGAADLLGEILNEEKAANDKLTELSAASNDEALETDEVEKAPARTKVKKIAMSGRR